MNNQTGTQYIFKDGCILKVIGDNFLFTNKIGQTSSLKKLSANHKKILSRLLLSDQEQATYDDLYNLYGKRTEEDGIDPATALSKMKGSMDSEIRPYIKSWHDKETGKRGYHIPDVKSVEELSITITPDPLSQNESCNADNPESKEFLPSELLFLSGEYYAFYPGKCENQILGAFIHIQQRENYMIAHAVLGITDIEDFRKVPSIFTVEAGFFSQINFDNFARIDRRNLFSGKIEQCSNHVITITLDSIFDCDRWQVALNIKDFLAHPREYTNDLNLYRGGLGIKLGGWAGEITASRIVLIRKSLFISKYMGLDSDDIKEYLKSSSRVYITEQADHEFYQWLMAKHPLMDM